MVHGVLAIEDERVIAKNMARFLERHGYEVRCAENGSDGLRQFEDFKPDVVLLDYNLPDISGLETLARIRQLDAQVKVIMITAHGSIRVAVEAMKGGAYDFVSKPLALNELKLLVDKAVGQEKLEGALAYYRKRDADDSGLDKILGESEAIQSTKRRIRQLIDAEARLAEGAGPPVLITGETGTGKELVARALHFEGARRDRPFVELNCSTLPPHLVESELFGFERGAFTDARERKLGLVETADGGTLFLDEIGDLEPAIQVKLLKLLEDKVVRRLGSVRDHRVDIRIVAATNRSLETLVDEGKFRSDLFFRLRVATIELPPLRERDGDIAVLAERFLAEHAQRYGKPHLRLSDEIVAALEQHSWPGNVRELRNAMEQAVLMANESPIGIASLSFRPDGLAARPTASHAHTEVPEHDGAGKLQTVERELIANALSESEGNVTLAARQLGVSRDTMRYRMKKHGLQA